MGEKFQVQEVIAYDDVADRWFQQIKGESIPCISQDSSAREALLDVFLVST